MEGKVMLFNVYNITFPVQYTISTNKYLDSRDPPPLSEFASRHSGMAI